MSDKPRCSFCKKELGKMALGDNEGNAFCSTACSEVYPQEKQWYKNAIVPEHYHKNGMDTFTFLENGFSPDVASGFYLGNVIKYIQRYKLKNGIEDLHKAKKYLETLIAFEEKTRE